MVSRFMPFLFDNKKAWESTLADPSYRHDMSFPLFMELYQAYRAGEMRRPKPRQAPTRKAEPLQKLAESNQCLSQSEVDALIGMLGRAH